MDSQNAGGPDRDSVTYCGYPALNHVEIITDEGRKQGRGPECPVCLGDRPNPVDRRGFVEQYAATPVHLRIDKTGNEHAAVQANWIKVGRDAAIGYDVDDRSEEHTSEVQSLMRISYAVFCLNKKNTISNKETNIT